MAAVLSLSLELPRSFRQGDVLSFHRRDPLAVAERVAETSLQKALILNGRPACLTLAFAGAAAHAELAISGRRSRSDLDAFEAMVRRMLGLAQDVGGFERTHGDHPQLGPLIAARAGLRVAVTATPFEALTWAITCQQISVRAAVVLRRRLIEAAGLRHASGLMCHPDAQRVGALTEGELREAGFSTTKAHTLLELSRLAASGEFPLDAWALTLPVDEMRARLGSIRGIGPWTIDYTLLRGYGWLGGSLHGDVAVRRGVQTLLGRPAPVSELEAKDWLAQFAPWRALAAAHIWAMRAAAAY